MVTQSLVGRDEYEDEHELSRPQVLLLPSYLASSRGVRCYCPLRGGNSGVATDEADGAGAVVVGDDDGDALALWQSAELIRRDR